MKNKNQRKRRLPPHRRAPLHARPGWPRCRAARCAPPTGRRAAAWTDALARARAPPAIPFMCMRSLLCVPPSFCPCSPGVSMRLMYGFCAQCAPNANACHRARCRKWPQWRAAQLGQQSSTSFLDYPDLPNIRAPFPTPIILFRNKHSEFY